MSEAKYTFQVPDMDCKHCQASLEQALNGTPGVRRVEVLLDEKLVRVDGEVEETTILKRIEKAGYSAKRVES